MRPADRDFLLFLLAIAAGSADGWSYVGLGHAFVANMTGNTVLIGLAVFQKNGDVLHPLISLACYVLGTAVASWVTRRVGAGSLWPRTISWTVLLETVLMASAEAGWVALHGHLANGQPALGRTYVDGLLGAVAFAIGLQSGAMVQLKIPGIVTTYITGTWTTLVSSGVRLLTDERAKTRSQTVQFEERLLMQASVIVVYLLSAVLTGWLFRYRPLGVGALPATSVLLVAAYGLIRG